MRRAKIACTIGPASRSPEMLRALIRAGMDVARLNFAFGWHQVHRENVQRIRSAAADESKPVAILMDLQNPKLRVGQLSDGGVSLQAGQEIILTTRSTPDGGEIIIASRTDRSFVDLVQHAAGLIVEESEMSSCAANLAVELGIATIIVV